MKFEKYGALAFACLIALSGCSQGEQKPDSTNTQVSSTPAASTDTASTTTTTTDTSSLSSGDSTSANKNAGGEVYLGTLNGVISDSMCGKDHTPMGDLGKDASACTEACVKKGAKYVLVDQKGDVYTLSNQEKPQAFAGKAAAITGHIDPTAKSIHVHAIAAQK